MAQIKNQTFGIEIEMNNITRAKASRVVAEYFGTCRYSDTAYRNGYRTWSAWDADGREWKFMRDCSIIANNDDERCEMVSPVLGWNDIETLQEVVRTLRKNGAKAHSSCGIHVHVGASEHTPKTLINLLNIVYKHYDLLERALDFSDRADKWCKKTDSSMLAFANTEKPKTTIDLAKIWYGYKTGCEWNKNNHPETDMGYHYDRSRYQLVNLHSFYQGKGVEFRAFNSTLHAGEVKAYVQFCLALNTYALNLKQSSMKQSTTSQSEYWILSNWLKAMGIKSNDEEFKTARFHLLKNLKKVG